MHGLDNDLVPPATVADVVYHVLSGSFRSISLALLAFSPSNRTLSHIKTIPAYGPHQYLALNTVKDVVYTTSWATPPVLDSWKLHREAIGLDVKHMSTVQITATSSYINIPPPYNFAYSAGGPTGEVHALAFDGSLGEKIQQLLFVPEDELESADKSRVALRYGSHGVEFSSTGYAFIPVLGSSTIEMYRRDTFTGRLIHVLSNPSPRGISSHDGPRHVKVHPNGKVLYCVTEHTNYIDTYEIGDNILRHLSTHSILPSTSASDDKRPTEEDPHLRSTLRGGTLMLTPSSSSFPAPIALFTTTRGATPSQKGWLSTFRLDKNGLIIPPSEGHIQEEFQRPLDNQSKDAAVRFETPTSSGKANALDIRAKGDDNPGFWVLLTDDDLKADESGAVRVLEWDGWGAPDQGLRIVAEWPEFGKESEGPWDEPEFTGASHAIWLD